MARVQSHQKIHVYLNATPAAIAGHVGNFKSVLSVAGREKPISHGVVIVAVGGQQRSTELYLHGKNPHVTTQTKLDAALAGGSLPPELAAKPDPTVVMIQCVESRNDKHPYCSRICCSEAVKNALEIKRRLPRAQVAILGRDIRTYGFREVYLPEGPRGRGAVHPLSGKQRPGGDRGRRPAQGDRPRYLEQPRPGPAAGPAGAFDRHRSGRRQPGAFGAAAQRPDGRRLLPRSPPQAAPGGSGQRRRVSLRPGAFAPLHRRDHRAGAGRRGARRHHPVQRPPGDSRPGGPRQPGELRRLRHLREGSARTARR